MTSDENDVTFCSMKPTDFLPNWDSLTPEEQERLKITHPAYFQDSDKRSTSQDSDIDYDGSSMISQEELDCEYHADEEDPLSGNGTLPNTEG